MKVAIWIATIAIALMLWLNTPDSLWRYLFYLRAPLMMGLLLLGLPFLAIGWLRAMLRNLFVLRGMWQMAFVITSAVMASTSVMLVANVILRNAPARFGVPPWIALSDFWNYGLAVLLSLPVCVTAIVLSKEKLDISDHASIEREKPKRRTRWTGVAIGVLLSSLLLLAVHWLQTRLDADNAFTLFLARLVIFLTKEETKGYLDGERIAPGHLLILSFFSVGALVYGFIAWRFRPRPQARRSEAPALLYVMFILAGATLMAGGMTFFFDFYRVLPLVLFLVMTAVGYALFNVDHFFELRKPQGQPVDSKAADFAAILQQRLQHQPGEKTLVLVCASGGGIQAAAWTVEVLMGLQHQLGPSFTQAIGLISSASGGSVGTLYFLDRMDPQTGYPPPQEFEAIFESATADSLDAVGWGLAYPDLWRLMGLPFLVPRLCDRGTAVERDWQGELANPDRMPSLGTWRSQALRGEIPIPVFNATLVEDGRRFLISPMTFNQAFDRPSEDKVVDFNTLYGNYDISAVTAARLSATFPYVSPICRSSINLKGKNYHIADGGYFDNSGIFTVVEWLDDLLGHHQIPDIKRVVLLQINAFPKASPNFQQNGNGQGGWSMALLGPLFTLFRVRDSTQTARNQEEIDLLCDRWSQQGVTIKHFPIFFPSFDQMQQVEKEFSPEMQRPYFFNQAGKYDPPLSWKLTNAEKKAIKRAWTMIAHKPGGEVQRLRDLWADWGMRAK